MSEHSILGASKAETWLNCPGSIRLVKQIPEGIRDISTPAADLGTAAHSLGEWCLRNGLPPTALSAPTRVNGRMQSYPVDQKMRDAITIYYEAVKAEYRRLGPGTIRLVEATIKPFDVSPVTDPMFGTADCVLFQPFGELVVIDYKNGRKPVDVEANDQLMYYACGGLQLAGWHDVTKVRIMVVQPNAGWENPVLIEDVSVEDMQAFAGRLRAGAIETENPNAAIRPGDWCYFCPATTHGCPEYAKAKDLAVVDQFEDLDEVEKDEMVALTPDAALVFPDPDDVGQLSDARRMVELLERWCKRVKALEYRAQLAGLKIPGRKLIQKGTQRRWVDSEQTEKTLRRKIGAKRCFKRTLISPAQAEKFPEVGKELVSGMVYKPPGELASVAESHKKPGVLPDYGFDDLDQLDTGE